MVKLLVRVPRTLFDALQPTPAIEAQTYDRWPEVEAQIISLVQRAFVVPLKPGCIVAADSGPHGWPPEAVVTVNVDDEHLTDAARVHLAHPVTIAPCVIVDELPVE